MPVIAAEVAIPAAARMRLEDHRQRLAIRRFVESSHLCQQRLKRLLDGRTDTDLLSECLLFKVLSLIVSPPLCYTPQLSTPVLGKHASPVVNRAKCFCVGSIQNLAAVAPHRDEVHVAKHLQMLSHTDGCSSSSASAISVTDRSSDAMNSRICRRRGSAIALKGSELVEARAMDCLYIPIWEYVKPLTTRGPRRQ